jgi:hypothetical protein
MFRSSDKDLPCLRNWHIAEQHEQSIKPIRGRSLECKPIGNRRHQHLTIRRGSDETIICRMYRTDVLTYHKSGWITVNLGGWVTQTTLAFISSVLGLHVVQRHGRPWIYARAVVNGGGDTGGDMGGKTVEGYHPLHVSGSNLLMPYEPNPTMLVLQNPAPNKTHRINRAGANNVRKQYKAFKDYIMRTMRIRDEGFSRQEFGEVFGWARPDVPLYPLPINANPVYIAEVLQLAASDNTEDHYKASLWLALSVGQFNYATQALLPPPGAMLRSLDSCILRHHRDQCFVEVDNNTGNAVADPYKTYFK